MRTAGLLVLLLTFIVLPASAIGIQNSSSPVSHVAVADSELVKAGPYDNGKMWAFEYPPTEYFKQEYGIDATPDWFERARLGALRLPNCTASFVSPHGLVMTNHHCVRSAVASLSGENEHLLTEGFYSRSLSDERPAPSLYVDQLIAIEDVTDEVYAAQQGLETIAERANARDEAIERIQQRKLNSVEGKPENYQVQVVSLYEGGRYSAYTFRRYKDLRLVMSPEIAIGHFGGDADNFTYPRYALDVSFLRVYEDGKPLTTDNYFRWSEDGAGENEPVFVVGNPGSTLRLETVAQLEFRRDYRDRQVLEFYRNRTAALRAAYEETRDDNVRSLMLRASNALKAYTGRIQGLEDPRLIARRGDAERQFEAAIEADPNLRAKYGTLISEIAALQVEKRDLGRQYAVYLSLSSTSDYTSETMKRALAAYDYIKRKEQGLGAEVLDKTLKAVEAVEDTPDPVDRHLLEGRIELMMDNARGADRLKAFFAGRTAGEVTADIFANSVLTSAASARRAIEDGLLTADDPALKFVASFADHRADFTSGWSGLEARETELESERGRAQFDVYGLTVPPDATFSLRIADGVVKGYDYNGTEAPPITTYYGLYDHYYSYRGSKLEEEWDLPDKWLDAVDDLALKTPFDIVSTNDIIGGNSGSPLLNSRLEVVGLVFDGNIESLPGAYIYLTDRARAVSVDSRGIIEALDVVYDMDRIVGELKTGQMVTKASGASN